MSQLVSIRSGYDRWATEYDDGDPSTLLDEPFVRRYCTPVAGSRLLDVGCGTGRYLRTIATPGVVCVGIDLSSGMLSRAQHMAATRPPAGPLSWVHASAWALPFRDSAFTHLVSGLVLDHVTDLDRFFHEIARVLARGGWAVISGIHPDMQRLTGCNIVVAGLFHIPGVIHEIAAVSRAACDAGLEIVAHDEPVVTPELIAQRPTWESRLGCPALVLMAMRKPLG
ncbi:MAG TPA: class I SAM-dependent methyltransferase [Nitrospirales bacterium]|nr:class I SAM-dependent methyltransferase [Nitrospirales bacterium]